MYHMHQQEMLAGSKNRVIGLFIVDMVERTYGLKNRITKVLTI